MLDQQFFGNDFYKSLVEDNFIPVHAVRGQELGDALYKKFAIRATPTVLIIDPDESEIDRIVGFGDAEVFAGNIKKVVKGTDTFASLLERHSENPDDILVTFKLARKYESTYNTEYINSAIELYKGILEKEDEAKNIGVPANDGDDMVSIYEFSKYALGAAQMYPARNPEGLNAFIEEFPESKLGKNAFQRLGSYYAYSAKPEDSEAFFEKALSRFPDEKTIMNYFVSYCVRNKTNIEKGVEVAEKMVNALTSSDYYYINNYAQILALSDDEEKLNKEYGEDYAKSLLRNSASAMRYYANFWLQKEENLESARDMIEMAIKMQPETYYYKTTAASIYLKLGDEKAALKLYGPDYIKKRMDSDRECYSYANFWAGKETNLKSALKAAKQAVKLKPETYYYWNTLGNVHAKMKNYKEAVNALEKALEISPNNARVKKQLEDIKAEMATAKK